MFDNFSNKIGKIFDAISGKKFVSEDDLNSTMREIRIALLEADVSLSIAKEFIEKFVQKVEKLNEPPTTCTEGRAKYKKKLLNYSFYLTYVLFFSSVKFRKDIGLNNTVEQV